MLNIKNLFVIIFSAILSAIITMGISKAIPLGILSGYLLSSFLAGFVILVVFSFMTASTQTAIQSSANGSKKSAKSQSKPAAGKITSAHEEGTVKWFDSKKGYGFITRSMGEDIFVHFRSIQGNGYRSLQEGQAVKYIVTKGDKGPQAEDIHVV